MCWQIVERNVTTEARQIVHTYYLRRTWEVRPSCLPWDPSSHRRKKKTAGDSDLVLTKCLSPTNGPHILETIRGWYFYKYNGYYKRQGWHGIYKDLIYCQACWPTPVISALGRRRRGIRSSKTAWASKQAALHNTKPCLKETSSTTAD